jgi:hypothetical protein
MKTLLIYLSFIFILSSCDPQECLTEKIQNKTELNLFLKRSSGDSSFTDTTYLKSLTTQNIGKVMCSKGGVVLDYSIYDSVYIESENKKILKIFYPNSSGKNIYNIDDWTVKKSGRRDYEYTFEITDDDIANCEE